MPANRFDTSVNQEYVSSYIPLPFQQLAALGEQAKTNFDEGKKLESDLDALSASIKSAPVYEKSRKDYVDKVNNQLRNLVDEYQGNYGDSEFKNKTRRLMTDVKNSTEVANFNKTLEAYNIWEKLKAQGNSKDLDYTYEMDSNDPTGFKQLNILEKPIYSSRFTKYSDWDKDAKESVGHIAPSGGEKIGDLLAKTQISNGKLYERKGEKWVGITNPKLESIVKQIVPVYASKSGGQHHLESILQQDYGFGNTAYNVTYRDIENNANQASLRISKNEGTPEDFKIVKMKNEIDAKLFNFIKASNQYQVGTIVDKTVNDQFIKDPETGGSGAGDKNNVDPNKTPWNLTKPNANPDLNPVAKNLAIANPNSVFKVNDKNEVEYITPDKMGVRTNVTYKDKSGKVWNPQNPPSGWKFYKDEASFKKDNPNILWKGGYSSDKGMFISSGGTQLPVYNLKPEYSKISNTDIYAKQVQEVLQWAAATGQYKLGEGSGYNAYNKFLPEYVKAIKNGALNVQYVPQFDAETADNFKEVFAPKQVVTNDGTVVKDPGLVSNWSIEGVNTNEEKMKILNNFNPIGLDMVKGGDNILINSDDGKQYSVKMNSPTLEATFNGLSLFIRDNNKAKINPNASDSKYVENSTINYFNNLSKNAKAQGIDSQAVDNQINTIASSFNDQRNSLLNNGYVQTSVYRDGKIIGISFINHTAKSGPEVVVLKYDYSTDDNFEITSEASFNREVQQKAIGNFTSNLNKAGSKTAASFVENQYIKD